jgi:CheY-like chemotaxis protein
MRLMEQIFTRRKDLELRGAGTAELGIEQARAEPPALILMDINLPGMDGYEALAVLKADPKTAAIPVVALTANAMKGDADRGRDSGFDDYVAKPLDVAAFLAMLNRLLK